MKDLIRKLKNRKGESIAETLIALLISALALTMLAAAISSAYGMITKTRNSLGAYYDANETGVIGMTDTGETGNITVTDSTESKTYATYQIAYYKNDKFPKTLVISYKKK